MAQNIYYTHDTIAERVTKTIPGVFYRDQVTVESGAKQGALQQTTQQFKNLEKMTSNILNYKPNLK